MLKVVLFLGIIGHILCGIGDYLVSCSPSGRLDLKGGLKDPKRMREVFSDMPLNWPLASILLGVFSIPMFGFGYLELTNQMAQYSSGASAVMYISVVIALMFLLVHHIICGLAEWFYIRLGRTDEAREAVMEFLKKTIVTMVVGYLGLIIFAATFFVMVVSGRTELPQWACVFNILPLGLILAPTKLLGKGNIAGALMFLGLLIVM